MPTIFTQLRLLLTRVYHWFDYSTPEQKHTDKVKEELKEKIDYNLDKLRSKLNSYDKYNFINYADPSLKILLDEYHTLIYLRSSLNYNF